MCNKYSPAAASMLRRWVLTTPVLMSLHGRAEPLQRLRQREGAHEPAARHAASHDDPVAPTGPGDGGAITNHDHAVHGQRHRRPAIRRAGLPPRRGHPPLHRPGLLPQVRTDSPMNSPGIHFTPHSGHVISARGCSMVSIYDTADMCAKQRVWHV